MNRFSRLICAQFKLIDIEIEMKQKVTALFAVLGAALALSTQVLGNNLNFSGIPVTQVVGSGVNQSGLIIDFNDGATTERYAFQYNWDGTAGSVSGAEMLLDVAAAVDGLSLGGDPLTAANFFLNTITFESQSEVNGDFVTSFDFWVYYTAGGIAGGSPVEGASSVIPDVLASSNFGAGEFAFGSPGRFIDDNSWDVWSFGSFESSYVVPEPASYAFLFGAVALGGVVTRRRFK